MFTALQIDGMMLATLNGTRTMVTTRWQRRDTNILRFGLGLVLAIAATTLLVASLNGLGSRSHLLSLLVLAAGAVTVIAVERRYAKSRVRVLKFKTEDSDREFRKLFKEHHIRFYRKENKLGYNYTFPGRGISMTIKDFQVPDVHLETLHSFTQVMLLEINATNEPFANHLADLIDEMAQRRSSFEQLTVNTIS